MNLTSLLTMFLKLHLLLLLCMCLHSCYSVHVVVRGQLKNVSSLFPPGFWGLNSAYHSWWQVPLLTEISLALHLLFFFVHFCVLT